MYSQSTLLYIRALTPIHVGVGRGEGVHVDLPVQRDEFGFPTIWASSFKGAVKANVGGEVKKYLGSEPMEAESTPSSISLLDAKLVFIPVRILDNVWTYATTPHLLGYLYNYLEIHGSIRGRNIPEEAKYLKDPTISTLDKSISTKFSGRIVVNEVELEVVKRDDLSSRLSKILPSEIKEIIDRRGLIVVPDKDNIGLEIVNRSLMIQYRVALDREKKTVRAGPWSEEYIPMETVFVSTALCRNYQQKDANAICNEFKAEVKDKTIFVGGKETIGKGLVKIIVYEL